MAVSEFRNEPFTDFSRSEEQQAFAFALAQVDTELGREYPLIIGGERVATPDHIASLDPADPSIVVGYAGKATADLGGRALQAALGAFPAWSRTPGQVRARILFKAAAILRRRRHEFSAWMVREVGKTWPEADADTAEAIDFLEFYGREMTRLAGPQILTRLAGEDNELEYIPLGTGVIIPPWNFPLAIMVGMTAAAMVAGNTVIVKPASATPVICAKFFEVLAAAGLPPGVANFLPGPGGEVGDFLVDHPSTRFISFTGSKEVGIRIFERAARVQPGQIWLKRVIAEMGGKDAIVVDADADLEDAATAITNSAFGYGGQKCSACSRAIVHREAYGKVLERVTAKTARLRVGPPREPAVSMGPVADKGAYAKVMQYIDIGRSEGRLVHGGGRPADLPGYFIEPTIFADVHPGARISQEEIFGPVLAFTVADSFRDAIRMANATEFGLTGAVFSRNRENIEYARAHYHVGNLYINRKCTGALVGAHPFGGFHMSGTDSKAGGRDYLLLLSQAKVVSEKL